MSRDYDDYEDDRDDHDEDGRRDDERDYVDADAADRTNLPGVFLIVVGVLNALWALYCIFNTAFIASRTPTELEAQQEMIGKTFGFNKDVLEQQRGGKTMEEVQQQQIMTNGVLAALALVGTVLPFLAGVRMRALRSYGLCVAGSVVAMIPCLSGSGCCLFGVGIGIWALIVLMSRDVKEAFR